MFPIFTGNLDRSWPANGPPVPAPSLPALLGRVIDSPSTAVWGLALLGATCLALSLLRRPTEHRMYAHWGLRTQLAAAIGGVVWVVLLAYPWWGLGPPAGYPRFWAPLVLACV